MAADLDSLITSEIPEGRQNLLDSYTNLERVAEYCENNYFQYDNKRAALEETKSYTTQSLASVAYQINTLAYNFLQMLDLQSSSIREMESQINHISQTVCIHKEKVARREIGVLTTNKCSNSPTGLSRQYKIIAPANPERPIKYVRKPIDYACLDDIGHGVRVAQGPRQLSKRPSMTSSGGGIYGTQGSPASQYGPGLGKSPYGSIGNVSQGSAGPAPTSKPPTPPQNRFPSGTLNRSKEYRTPPVVAPPQVPSNYAPNYPKGSRGPGQQYGTLPHPQVGQVQPQPHSEGGATMPRLSSNSVRSNVSGQSQTPTPPPESQYGGLVRKVSTSSADQEPQDLYRAVSRQNSQVQQYGTAVRGSTPPTMTRPSQRPPSPPLPTPPQQQQSGYSRQASQEAASVYGTRAQPDQSSIYGTRAQPDPNAMYGTRTQLQPDANLVVYGTRAQPDSAAMYGTRAQPDPSTVYGTRAQPDPNALYGAMGTRAQLVGEQPQQVFTRSSGQPSGVPPALPAGGPPGLGLSRQMSSAPALPAGGPPGLGLSRQMSSSSVPGITAQAPQEQLTRQSSLVTEPVYSRQTSQASSVVSGGEVLPAWVPKNYLEKVLAIYDYNADKEDELTFQEGQVIYVLKKNDDGWWEGVMEGITGLFPGNYVEPVV